MKKIYTLLLSLCIVTPVVSFALLTGTVALLKSVKDIMNLIIPIMAGVAVVYFFYGMGQFILHSGDPKTHEAGRQQMIYGIIALFIIFSIMGIVNFIGSATGITPGGTGSPSGNGCVDGLNPQGTQDGC
jgi:prepilin signal peptidase PulO-like enzyme (type II secretory pathway)